MKFEIKRFLPHIIAVIVFAAITLTFFAPLLDNMQVKQHDVETYHGMAKEIQDFRKETGEEPLWTNSMFGGMAAYQISVLFPMNLISKINHFFKTILPVPSSIIFLCFIGFYFMLISLKVDPWISFAGAIAFGFSSYFPILIAAGHNPKGFAIAYMAPVVAGVLMAYRGKMVLGASIMALALSLEIESNHLQITYYLLLIVLFLVGNELVRHFKEKTMPSFIKASALLAIGAVIAVLPNLTGLVLTTEYAKYSTRGKSELTSDAANKTSGLDRDYATQWSYRIDETFTLMVPDFKGGATGAIGNNKNAMKEMQNPYNQYIANMDSYFGNQPSTSGPVYVGAIICFLFMLSFFVVKDRIKWWLLAATILSIMLAWGRHFMPLTNFFMDFVPGYNKFRAVAMTLVIAEFTIPLLAVLALKSIVERPEILKEKRKGLLIAFGVTAGLCIVFTVLPDMFNTYFKDGEEVELTAQLKQAQFPDDQVSVFLSGLKEARMNIVKADALRSFFFILMSAGLLFFYSIRPFNRAALMVSLSLLILIDLFAVDKRYLGEDHYEPKREVLGYDPTEANLEILKDKDPNYRVFNLSVSPFNDASTSYFHKSIGGYHGAKMKRYQELIEYQISKNNMEVLNMLNTRYFITPDQNKKPMVQRNPDALGNAWFVKNYKVVENADAEINALTDFKAAETAIIDKRYQGELKGIATSPDTLGKIKLDAYKPNHLTYSYSTSSPQLAVFSEIFYDKGWNAYVDDKLVPHFRANYVLRSMVVPAGSHKLEFKFEPEFYRKGQTIALISSILLLLCFIGAVIFDIKKSQVQA